MKQVRLIEEDLGCDKELRGVELGSFLTDIDRTDLELVSIIKSVYVKG